jgi:hypothetical protein
MPHSYQESVMRRSFRPSLVSLVSLSFLLQGCQTWARYDVPTETAPSSVAVAAGRPVRVSMRDGTQLMMSGTRVIGDSVVGDGTGDMGRIAVPVAGVRKVEELRTNKGLNAVLAFAVGGAALAGLALLALVQAMEGG